MTESSFAARLIDWQRQHGRHDLPWQNTREVYRIWLSEIMLQQTQVASVIPYYQRFLERFPRLADLAAASVEEVMSLWSGLGYYARARNLHRCAQMIDEQFAGRFPQDPQVIGTLPGIGRSTANAIAVFAFDARAPILDGNVKRVLCRVFGIDDFPGAGAAEQRLWQLAHDVLPVSQADCATYIQAQMDLGATLCTRTKPACSRCPLVELCIANREGRTHELPRARPRKLIPQRTMQVLLLRDGRQGERGEQEERWLFERRPPTGIWGGLMSLPEAETPETLEQLERSLGRLSNLTPLGALRHSFTHFQLTLQPLMGELHSPSRATEHDRYCWLTRDEALAAGLPAPVRRIVTHAWAQEPL